jgi:hypothetical protein
VNDSLVGIFFACIWVPWQVGAGFVALFICSYVYTNISKRFWLLSFVSFLTTYIYSEVLFPDEGGGFISIVMPTLYIIFMAFHTAWTVPLLLWLWSKISKHDKRRKSVR